VGPQGPDATMRNLIIDGAAGSETKRRHDVTFPLLTLHRGKDRVHFSNIFLHDFSKKKTLSIPVSCRFFVRKTDDILRSLLLMQTADDVMVLPCDFTAVCHDSKTKNRHDKFL
jgi:hypothetical protein